MTAPWSREREQETDIAKLSADRDSLAASLQGVREIARRALKDAHDSEHNLHRADGLETSLESILIALESAAAPVPDATE